MLRGSPRKMFSESLYEGKGGAALKTSGESLAKESFAGEIVKKLLGKGYVRVSGEQVPLTDEEARKPEKYTSCINKLIAHPSFFGLKSL